MNEGNNVLTSNFITEGFWLFAVIVYETACFIGLSSFAVSWSFCLAGIFPFPNALAGLNPTCQILTAILILIVCSYIHQVLERYIIPVRPFINHLKARYPILLPNVPAILSILAAFLAAFDVLYQYYRRFEIIWDLPEFHAHPMSCIFAYGIHMKNLLPALLPAFWNNDLLPPVPEKFVSASENATRFTLALMYLSYFVYKKALKRLPMMAITTFSESALTHVKTDTVFGLLTIGVTFVLDAYILHRPQPFYSDMSLVVIIFLALLIAELVPWYIWLSDGEEHYRNEYEKEVIQGCSYWVHSFFGLITIAVLTFLFFQIHVGAFGGVIAYSYDRDLFSLEENGEITSSDINQSDGYKALGFFPKETPNDNIELENEKKLIRRHLKISYSMFRSLYAVMLFLMSRTIIGYMKFQF